jgi:hypothetical protein
MESIGSADGEQQSCCAPYGTYSIHQAVFIGLMELSVTVPKG